MTPSNKLQLPEIRRKFAESLTRGNGRSSLLHTAMMIAAEEEAGVDVESYEAQIANWSNRCLTRATGSAGSIADVVLDLVYGELGFQGNASSYYDPQNSYLNRVIDRRIGIPITLGVVVIAMGRGAGLNIDGVGMPGHFLVRIKEGRGNPFLIDPFSGTAISREQCQRKLNEIFDGNLELKDEHLRRITDREIIERMLRNLKSIYYRAGLFRRELSVAERIVLVSNKSLTDILERGLCRERVGNFAGAIDDLRLCMGVRAIGPEFKDVADHMKRVTTRLASLN